MLRRWHSGTASDKISSMAENFMSVITCSDCQGYRLKKESLHFKVNAKHIGELSLLDIQSLHKWMVASEVN